MLIDLYRIVELVEIEDQPKKGHLMPFRILEYLGLLRLLSLGVFYKLPEKKNNNLLFSILAF